MPKVSYIYIVLLISTNHRTFWQNVNTNGRSEVATEPKSGALPPHLHVRLGSKLLCIMSICSHIDARMISGKEKNPEMHWKFCFSVMNFATLISTRPLHHRTSSWHNVACANTETTRGRQVNISDQSNCFATIHISREQIVSFRVRGRRGEFFCEIRSVESLVWSCTDS